MSYHAYICGDTNFIFDDFQAPCSSTTARSLSFITHFFQLISLIMKGRLTSLAALLLEVTTILTMPNSFEEGFFF